MARLMIVLAFAATVALAFAANSTVTPSVAVTTTTMAASTTSTTSMTPTPTSTAPHATSTPMISPSPTPGPPVMPPNNSYHLMNENGDGEFCLRLTGGLALNFTYTINATMVNFTAIDFENNTKVSDNSVCNSSTLEAILILEYAPKGESKDYYLTLNFTGSPSKDDPRWTLSHLMINFTFNATEFPNYKGNAPPSNEQTTTYTNQSLIDTKVEYNRSFICKSEQDVGGFEPFTSDHSINVTLQVDFLQVQAFSFRNATSGAFDNARECVKDNANAGNKIVPIAVGAALAGLVIVVLIAYLIGRLRNRRKSSYEALS